ncbi:hypothetical protein Tco_0394971, partial [Tanacetum coccineum]
SGTDTEPLEQVHNDAEYNVFANVRRHSKQPESTSNICLVEKDDSNVTPDSPDMCDKDIDINEDAKLKPYEILVVKEKHDELVKQSLLTKSHFEGLIKEKTKVITDLKLKEEKDIDKMI